VSTEPQSGARPLLSLPHDTLDAELAGFLSSRGQPSYRAGQVADWVFRRRVLDYGEMTNLPVPLRAELAEAFPIRRLREDSLERSEDGTLKYLWQRPDGKRIESVRIPTKKRVTLCVSSQVGCPLACTFCATGLMGLLANLDHGEIVEQVLAMLEGEAENESVNVVFMGMGEPMLNMDAVLESVRVLNDRAGIGARRITISTAGIAPEIERLAEFPLQVRLSVSLHAATDEVRSGLMPINGKYPLAALMEACRAYAERSGRRPSFEYVQLPGLNDTPEMVRSLKGLLGEMPAKLNLIPYNAIPGSPHRVPTRVEIDTFRERLERAIPQPVSVREPRGSDVTGACGQLAAGATERGARAAPSPDEP
jgi:23S rRNA (adenine2503-C2)-methyltransferase